MSDCPRYEQIEERLLGADRIDELPVSDLEHLQTCHECWRLSKHVTFLDSSLKDLAGTFKRSCVADPIAVPVPVSRTGPGWGLLVPLAMLGFGLLFLAYVITRSQPTAQPLALPTPSVKPLNTPAAGAPAVGSFLIVSRNGKANTGSDERLFIGPEVHQSGRLMELESTNSIRIRLTNALFQVTPSGLTIKRGQISVVVRKPGTDFSVVTPVAILGVRGTIFHVVVGPAGETFVRVDQGKVSIANAQGEEQMLTLGESLQISSQGTFFEVGQEQAPPLPTFDAAGPQESGGASATTSLNE